MGILKIQIKGNTKMSRNSKHKIKNLKLANLGRRFIYNNKICEK